MSSDWSDEYLGMTFSSQTENAFDSKVSWKTEMKNMNSTNTPMAPIANLTSIDKNNNPKTPLVSALSQDKKSMNKPSPSEEMTSPLQAIETAVKCLEKAKFQMTAEKNNVLNDLETANIHIKALKYQLGESKEKHKKDNKLQSDKIKSIELSSKCQSDEISSLQSENMKLKEKLETNVSSDPSKIALIDQLNTEREVHALNHSKIQAEQDNMKRQLELMTEVYENSKSNDKVKGGGLRIRNLFLNKDFLFSYS